jgi:hypothetical protein
MKLEPLAVTLAKLAGRPVRVALTQEEEFLLINNHAAVVRDPVSGRPTRETLERLGLEEFMEWRHAEA